MGKIFIQILAASLFISIIFFGTPVQAANKPKPAVFFLPHQDDEMFMLGTIRAKLDVKKNVYVVMVTDGGHSSVRTTLNKKYNRSSKSAFVAARNHEFYRVMASIGVPPAHILFANPGGVDGDSNPRYQDSELTILQATEIINRYYDMFGEGEYYTVKANAGHADHEALYIALRDFEKIKTKQYFSEIAGEGDKIVLSKKQQRWKSVALGMYYEWNPLKGRFAIAAHSVKHLLDFWRTHDAEYIFAD